MSIEQWFHMEGSPSKTERKIEERAFYSYLIFKIAKLTVFLERQWKCSSMPSFRKFVLYFLLINQQYIQIIISQQPYVKC